MLHPSLLKDMVEMRHDDLLREAAQERLCSRVRHQAKAKPYQRIQTIVAKASNLRRHFNWPNKPNIASPA